MESQNQPESRPAYWFKPGQSGNPAGKPVGSRNKLQGDFMRALAEDFAEHGKAALVSMRTDDPSGYIRAIASLMPKELEISRPLDEIDDDQLDAAILAVRAILAAQGDGADEGVKALAKPAQVVPALP